MKELNCYSMLKLSYDLINTVTTVNNIFLEFSSDNTYSYDPENVIINMPKKIKVREAEKHHMSYLYGHYNLDYKKYKHIDERIIYHVIAILHELGHYYTEKESIDCSKEYDYFKYMSLTEWIDLNYYREIHNEKLADKYLVDIWKEHEHDIIKLLEQYSSEK